MDKSVIIKQLQQMRDIDQAARLEVPTDWDKISKIDKANTQNLKEILKEYGWITISKFGTDASSNCWLIAQHADLDPEFQRYCLDLMSEVKNDVDIKLWAMLVDRVLIKETGKQRYGTQYQGRDNGKYAVLAPLEDESSLDILRSSVGYNIPIKDVLAKRSKPTFINDKELEEYKSNLE